MVSFSMGFAEGNHLCKLARYSEY